MSRSSMTASSALSGASPRTSARKRTSLCRTGRPSTTAEIRSTTSARAPAARSAAPSARPTTRLERMADREVEAVRRLAEGPVELVSPVDAERSEGRLVAQTNPRGIAELPEVDVANEEVDAAHLRERGHRERAARVDTELGPRVDERVAAGGDECSVLGRRARAHRVLVVAAETVRPAEEEPLGQGEGERLSHPVRAGEAEPRGERKNGARAE